MVEAAARAALTAPRGPVSLEIPIDVQREQRRRARAISRLGPIVPQAADPKLLDELADVVRRAQAPDAVARRRRARSSSAARDLAERGFAVVTSTNGRAVVPEAHPHTLGAYNMTPEAQAIYDRADLMIVVGSRLRGNETRNNAARLPQPLDPDRCRRRPGRAQLSGRPVHQCRRGGRRSTACAERLPARLEVDATFLGDIAPARKESERKLAAALGPYRVVADALQARVARGAHPFVRDVTLSNSTFGNRYVHLAAPHLGVHALGGGIGQGIAMAVGAALAGAPAKTIALLGDGGTMVNLGELATAVDSQGRHRLRADERPRLRRHPQHPGRAVRRPAPLRRSAHAGLFGLLAAALGLPHRRVSRIEEFEAALDGALAASGPQLVEVDMVAIGPFAESFAGPPAGAAGSA